ncbi:alpha/beta-hydrolase [Daedalea quercina L-15889]|uniref:Alpha/beta-hydrolase n=1 Tax=Daedalea quercina L-15889 TaxID=1314783 RepID=A0A165SPI8_9APHY|nr:alpha/beta-hydrolase [Daedalea quercina L-15889]
MPLNSLLGQAGLRLGPLLLETLVKHYIERIVDERGDGVTDLSRDELLYDQAFHVVKVRFGRRRRPHANADSITHTVEELQEFSNTRTPSPPWTRVVRLLVPMSSCDDAATYLIKALGGEEVTKKVVGGTKWWQVRGVRGVDAEWITMKKDWREAKKRSKAHQKENRSPSGASGDAHAIEDKPAAYDPEMDKMRCILYAHGGGYYFGSIDQERYSLERYARKIGGRVFAINYRLAPQYPFPCAIQDFLAAYLYLIRPPPEASHCPVDPAHIVLAGDSAGGGLTLALLQVIRDSGLPLPAGAVLISPWCDLTHSFPSVHINNATDVLPPYGLSFHKPSTLWPPPPNDLTAEVQNSIRTRIREFVHVGPSSVPVMSTPSSPSSLATPPARPSHEIRTASGETVNLGSTAHLPPLPTTGVRDQAITFVTEKGETLRIEQQVQLYCPNYLVAHPLISPVVGYLGGLPPLLIIASEKEVIRDEIFYIAHKAAYPDKFMVKGGARDMYPALVGIESRYGPTKVHLQVWDDAAHTLPTLFAFTTPAKYCYRAIATFCKFATGMLPPPSEALLSPDSQVPLTSSPASTPPGSPVPPSTPLSPGFNVPLSPPALAASPHSSPSALDASPSSASSTTHDHIRAGTSDGTTRAPARGSSRTRHGRRAVSTFFHRHTSHFFSDHEKGGTPSSDVAGPRFGHEASSNGEGQRRAGEPSVYDNGMETMIRERVSTHGVIRPLEPESELPALQLPIELVGEVSELVVRRYYAGREEFGRRFAKVYKSVEKQRRRNISRHAHDALQHMAQLQTALTQDESEKKSTAHTQKGIQEGLISTGSWPWAWALDVDEAPPPSSIVARRDTSEALRLMRIADQAFLMDEHAMSGNHLWNVIVEFLTKSPDQDGRGRESKPVQKGLPEDRAAQKQPGDAQEAQEARSSRLSRFLSKRRGRSKSVEKTS